MPNDKRTHGLSVGLVRCEPRPSGRSGQAHHHVAAVLRKAAVRDLRLLRNTFSQAGDLLGSLASVSNHDENGGKLFLSRLWRQGETFARDIAES